MVTIILRHDVKDFEEWKKYFDADEPRRANEGVKLLGLYTSVNNPNDVTMIFEAPNEELYYKMMSDHQLQETMKKAGVISAPRASILNRVS